METKDRSADGVGPAEGRCVLMAGARLVTTKVAAEQTGGAYFLFEVEVRPGGGEGPHVQHRDDECLCVLEGRFEILIEDERFEAVPGSVIYVPKGTLHAFRDVSKTAGKLLVIHTPGGSHECFVEETGEPATDGIASPTTEEPPDIERLAVVGAEYGVEIVPPPP